MSFFDFLAPILGGIGGSVLGGAVGPSLGAAFGGDISSSLGAEIGGAAGGALGGGLTTGLPGALAGGIGGFALGPTVSDFASSAFGGGGGASGSGSGGVPSGSTGSITSEALQPPSSPQPMGGVSAVSSGAAPGDLSQVGNGDVVPDWILKTAVPGTTQNLTTGAVVPNSTPDLNQIRDFQGSAGGGTPVTGADDPMSDPRMAAAVQGGKPDVPDSGGAGLLKSLGLDGMHLSDIARLAVPAAAMGVASTRSQNLPQSVPLTGQAQTLGAQGAQNLNALTTGQLPPGAKTVIDQATHAAKANIRSQFASMGLAGSSMEASALAQVDAKAAEQTLAQINSLVNTGLNETHLSSSIYQNLLADQVNQDKELSGALANFAGSFAGSTLKAA